MGGANTPAIVASMTNKQGLRNFPNKEREGDAVSMISFPVEAKPSIAITVSRSLPLPTPVGHDFHLLHKALFDSFHALVTHVSSKMRWIPTQSRVRLRHRLTDVRTLQASKFVARGSYSVV